MLSVTLPKYFQPFYCSDLVRFGKDNDGGYLINKQDVLNTNYLVSLGIGDDWSFEKQFTDTQDCYLTAYDSSLDAIKLSENNDLYTRYSEFFTKNKVHINKNIGTKFGNVPFNKVITGDNIFLKCDIEGDEYTILDDIIINSKLFTGMVIEFHEINKPKNFNSLVNFISKIDQKLLHIHINNYFYYKTDNGPVPDIMELTFTSSSNIKLEKYIPLPNKLDMPNNPMDDEFKILF